MEEHVFDKRGEEFAEFRVRRTVAGVEVTIKSAMVEDFMKAMHHRACRGFIPEASLTPEALASQMEVITGSTVFGTHAFQGHRLYQIDGGTVLAADLRAALAGTSGSITYDQLPMQNGRLNLAWLRVEGLSTGVTVTFPTQMTREQLRKFVEDSKNMLVRFYGDYLCPFNVRTVLTVGQVQDVALAAAPRESMAHA